MEHINEEFSKHAIDYPQSFSFGIVYINGNEDTSMEMKILLYLKSYKSQIKECMRRSEHIK